VRNSGVVFNIAQVSALMGRSADAYNWYEVYLTQFDLEDDWRQQGTAARDALLPQVAVVDLTTDPPGAEIFVDRQDLGAVGHSPRRIAVEPGERTLIARLPGHREDRASVVAVLGEVTPAHLTLAPQLGVVSVGSVPPGATVRRFDTREAIGTTPLEVSLPVGAVTLIVEHEGYVEQVRRVSIEEDQRQELEVELRPEGSRVAVLTVQGTPRAMMYMDGREIGRTPLTLGDLEPGARRLRAQAEGHESWEGTVVLEPGGAARLDYRLAEIGAGPWTGWRFLGYGGAIALVVAGVVVGAIARSERDAFFESATRDGFDTVGSLNVVADVLWIGGLVVGAATLVWDLVTPPAPGSSARVTLDR
jgi:hypothetical protein